MNGAIPRHAVLYLWQLHRQWRPILAASPNRTGPSPAGLPRLLALAFLILGSPAFAQPRNAPICPDALAALEAKYPGSSPRVGPHVRRSVDGDHRRQDGGFSVSWYHRTARACMVASRIGVRVLPPGPAGVDG